MNAAHPFTRTRNKLLLCFIAAAAIHASTAVAAAPQPVLLVIANEDFHYAEYAAARAALQARGLPVVVGAGEARLARPQGVGAGSTVRPDVTLVDRSGEPILRDRVRGWLGCVVVPVRFLRHLSEHRLPSAADHHARCEPTDR